MLVEADILHMDIVISSNLIAAIVKKYKKTEKQGDSRIDYGCGLTKADLRYAGFAQWQSLGFVTR